MIRDVDLVSYLPSFIADYKEINLTLSAENPEFILAWKSADRALKNEFIATADEYGISRFEKILGIYPLKEDSLESRRIRVQSKWFTTLPYTWRVLLKKLSMLCGEQGFKAYIPEKNGYKIRICILTDFYVGPPLAEVKQMLESFIPANILLLLYAEYEAQCNVVIQYGNRIIFRSRFYSRLNLDRLKLDRTWKLDGSRKLSGYNSQMAVDLYPVRLRIRAGVEGTPQENPQICLQAYVKEEIKGQAGAVIRLSAKHRESLKEQLKVAAAASVEAWTGDVHVYNKNRLDGKWKLNGGRKLNGGTELR